MTLEELKALIEKANETQHDDHNLNCGVCKAAADLSDLSRTALPAALALIEQMEKSLSQILRDEKRRMMELKPGAPAYTFAKNRVKKAYDALTAYEAFKKNVNGD